MTPTLTTSKTPKPSHDGRNARRKFPNCARMSMPLATPRNRRRRSERPPKRRRNRCAGPCSGKGGVAVRPLPKRNVRATMRTTRTPTSTTIPRTRTTTMPPPPARPSKRNASTTTIRGTKNPNPASSPTWAGMPPPSTTFPKSSACPKSASTDRSCFPPRATCPGNRPCSPPTSSTGVWSWSFPTSIPARTPPGGTTPWPSNFIRRPIPNGSASTLPLPITTITTIYCFTSIPDTSRRGVSSSSTTGRNPCGETISPCRWRPCRSCSASRPAR
mmetsp:Transcript_31050/g.53072  ORF Transcript_31050/g.53072 Transcript_31050/m.53072 type:complete len:273 (+) Transcript_31050:691-1509(+)